MDHWGTRLWWIAEMHVSRVDLSATRWECGRLRRS